MKPLLNTIMLHSHSTLRKYEFKERENILLCNPENCSVFEKNYQLEYIFSKDKTYCVICTVVV